MSLEEFKNIEDLYKAKTFGTIRFNKTRQEKLPTGGFGLVVGTVYVVTWVLTLHQA